LYFYFGAGTQIFVALVLKVLFKSAAHRYIIWGRLFANVTVRCTPINITVQMNEIASLLRLVETCICFCGAAHPNICSYVLKVCLKVQRTDILFQVACLQMFRCAAPFPLITFHSTNIWVSCTPINITIQMNEIASLLRLLAICVFYFGAGHPNICSPCIKGFV
jgi:hypothetical protein